jgi:hypothetical protein
MTEDNAAQKEYVPEPVAINPTLARIARLEIMTERLDKEIENMSYLVMGMALFIFVLMRRVAFREDIPGLEEP